MVIHKEGGTHRSEFIDLNSLPGLLGADRLLPGMENICRFSARSGFGTFFLSESFSCRINGRLAFWPGFEAGMCP